MSPCHAFARSAQRGVILFIALIVLVAMSLAGVALMRSVDTNVLIAGNLAFRQATTGLGDVGIEAARTWMNDNANLLNDNQPLGNTFYWAQIPIPEADFIKRTPTTADDFNWATGKSVAAPDPAYEIAYVIHRLCKASGAPSAAGTLCVGSAVGGGAGSGSSPLGTKGTVGYGSAALPGTSAAFYRITVRVTGPRNTVSFVQAVLN